MSGPYPLSFALISERNSTAGEIVVAASSFMEMPWFSVRPVSTYNTCRNDFLQACYSFATRRSVFNNPKEIVSRILEPSPRLGKLVEVWLAFDKAGYDTACKIVEGSGKSPHEKIFHFPSVVQLFEHTVPDPPKNNFDSWSMLLDEQFDPWRKLVRKVQSDWS